MQKIASPQDLQSELRRLIAYAEGEQPSREKLAADLRELADRVGSGDHVAAASFDFEKAYQTTIKTLNMLWGNVDKALKATEAGKANEAKRLLLHAKGGLEGIGANLASDRRKWQKVVS